MDLQKIVDAAGPLILAFGLKIIGALAAWIAGRWLIGVVVNIVSSAMERQKIVDELAKIETEKVEVLRRLAEEAAVEARDVRTPS